MPHVVLQDETERLALLHSSRLLDAEVAPAFDALTRLVASQLDCPIAAINLIDGHRVWSMSRIGLEGRQASRADSFCATAILQTDPLIVRDARADIRFAKLPLVVNGPQLRAYIGVPLLVEGRALGTVCALDTICRNWTDAQVADIKDLGLAASSLIESKLVAQRFRKLEARVRTASLAGSDWLWETNDQGQITWVSASLLQHTGLDPAGEIGLKASDFYQPRGDDTEDSWNRYLQARARREPFCNAVAERMTPRGRITVSISGVPVFDSQGRFMGYRGASRNVTRQLAAEHQAHQADQLLRQAVESFHAAVMISAPDGRIVMSNSRWLRSIGASLDPDHPYWPDTLRNLLRAGAYPDAVGREDDYFDWRMALHKQAEAQEIPFKDKWLLMKDHRLPDGSTVHFGLDITENKLNALKLQAQARALEESEARLNAVLRALPDLWAVIKMDGTCLDAHPDHPWIDRIKTDRNEQVLDAAMPPEQAQVHREAIEEAHRIGRVQRLEFTMTTGEGERRHVESRLAPMPDGHTLFLFRDITERQQAAENLRLSEERWKFALEGAGDGVWDWDLGRQRVFYSPRWKAMLGYAEDEIGEGPEAALDLLHPGDRDRIREDLAEYCATGRGIYQAEQRMRHKHGHYLWILTRGKVSERAVDGRPRRIVGTHSDITPIKQIEHMLREKQSAEAASSAKSEFLSRMSHEIRTPLNAVNGFAQLLQLQFGQTKSDPSQVNYVEQILRASQHLMSLVNDVLDLQQVEAGILTLKLENLSLHDEVQHCAVMLGPSASARRVTLLSNIPADVTVRADPQRLHQVLMNLGSNAIKYNVPAGHVRFDAEMTADQRVMLTVADTGPGMSAQELSRLFQPFERLGRETSNAEGTGLGLIITRSLIEAMGGCMEIRSQPGHGTRIQVILPQAGQASNSTARSALPASGSLSELLMTQPDNQVSGAPSLPALRVLYVEDNRINAMLFEEALRPYPQINLEIAEDGQMALAMAREAAPDVVVLDAHLPGMSGFDVLRALRTIPTMAGAPAYMCSADAMPEDVARARAEGFTGYWTKPIDIIQITTELCRLADTREVNGGSPGANGSGGSDEALGGVVGKAASHASSTTASNITTGNLSTSTNTGHNRAP